MAQVYNAGSFIRANTQQQQLQQRGSCLVNRHDNHEAAPHGTKRPAESSLESEQPLSKRFDLLKLADALDASETRFEDPPGMDLDPYPPTEPKVKLPFASHSPDNTPPSSPTLHPTTPSLKPGPTPHPSSPSSPSHPIFLADIEAHLSRIPDYVLRPPEREQEKWRRAGEHGVQGEGLEGTRENAVVLYRAGAGSSGKAEGRGQRGVQEQDDDVDAMDLD